MKRWRRGSRCRAPRALVKLAPRYAATSSGTKRIQNERTSGRSDVMPAAVHELAIAPRSTAEENATGSDAPTAWRRGIECDQKSRRLCEDEIERPSGTTWRLQAA